jgi:hypothetical protein
MTPSLRLYHYPVLATRPLYLRILARKHCEDRRHAFFSGLMLKIQETDNKVTVSHDTRVTLPACKFPVSYQHDVNSLSQWAT